MLPAIRIRLHLVSILLLFFTSSLFSQYSLTGPTPVLPGIYYGPYTISVSSGTWHTTDHWTVTGGTINQTSNTTINNDGTPSIGITWNSGVTTGTVAYYISGSSNPVATFAVCIVNNSINSGTLNAQYAPDYYPFVPSGVMYTLNLSASDASTCGAPITYFWEISTDGTNFTSVPNSYNLQNLTIYKAFTQTAYYRRGVWLGSNKNYTNNYTVTPASPVTVGVITPGNVLIKSGNSPGTFTATAASGGNMCGGTYTYNWQTSTDNINWTNISGATGLTYSPGLTYTKTYLRQSAYCGPIAAYSDPVIVTLYLPLNGGLVSPSSVTIAPNTSPGVLTGNPASNGNTSQSYVYTWQSSTDGGITFNDITSSNVLTYSPPSPNASILYRRKVTCDGQTAYSNTVTINTGTLFAANYVKSRTVTASNITTSSSADALTALSDVKQTTNFYDGLGRQVQSVAMKGSLTTSATPSPKDLVSSDYYDVVDNEVFNYLPYVSSATDGAFKPYALVEQNSFNNSQYLGETYNYGQINFEASPLKRINSISAAGLNWTGTNLGVRSIYTSNTANDLVMTWNVTEPSSIGNFGSYTAPNFYPTGALLKKITVDEKGRQSIEFRDKNGRTILKKVQLNTATDDGSGCGYKGWLCTYYIYDDLGNLRCVVQPHGVELLIQNSWDITALSNVILNEQCFRYEYDSRNRIIMKKMPGADPIYMIYDALDRLAMTQDGNLRGSGKWLTTLYENTLDREVQTGLYSTVSTFSALLSAASTSTNYPFAVSSVPTYPTWEMLTQIHYDNYTSIPTGLSGNLNTTDITTANFYSGASCNVSPTYIQPLTQNSTNSTMGLPTWTQTEVLGSGGAQYISSSNIYDEYGRIIQQQTINYSAGLDISTTQYDFSGKSIIMDGRHQMKTTGNPTQTYEVVTRNSYDDLGRALMIEKKVISSTVPSPAWKTTATMAYNAIGGLVTKTVGNDPANTGSSYVPLEKLVYEYNIRGWLLGANRNYAVTASTAGNYFGFDLGYDKTAIATSTATAYNNPQYNGNIEGMVWKTRGDGVIRKYDFTYDAVNRLQVADFTQYNGNAFAKDPAFDFSVPSVSYEANGNIKNMQQWGWKAGTKALIDDLTYIYQSNTNKLQNVMDKSNDPQTTLGDFRTATTHPQYTSKQAQGTDLTTITDYSYDANGNLTKDDNKAISSIKYNYLNLPTVITITSKGNITYTYDATGNKIQKVTVDNTVGGKVVTTTTTYISGFVYESKATSPTDANNPDYTNKLQFLTHEEGRIRQKTDGTFAYDYFLKDHLGNVRMVLTEDQRVDTYPTLDWEGTSGTTAVTNQDAVWSGSNGAAVGVVANRTDKTGVPGQPFGSTNVPPNGAYVRKLQKSTGSFGGGMLLKVMSGDVLNTSVDYFYNVTSANNTTANGLSTMATSLLAAITGNPTVSATAKAGASTATGAMNTAGSTADQFFAGEKSSTVTNKPPEAYMHVLFFNDQFIFDKADSYSEQVSVPNALKNIAKTVQAKYNGYAYIYFSNESESPVWFDNLQLQHVRGPVLEETHYYPFGLTMAGISSKALSFGDPGNKKLFNGNELQNKEFSDLSGLEWTDFNARSYDQQTGRFLQIDPEVENGQESMTPYQFGFDNPVRYNDPTGKCPFCVIPWVVYEIGAAVVAGVTAYTATEHPLPVNEALSKLKTAIENADFSNSNGSMTQIPSSMNRDIVKLDTKSASDLSSSSSTDTKKVPNPNGKNGGKDHQETISKEADKMKQEGYDVIEREVPVQTPGGTKEKRYIDLQGTNSETGEVKQVQVGKQNKNGTPVSREVKALNDIENSTRKRPTFVPYNNPFPNPQ